MATNVSDNLARKTWRSLLQLARVDEKLKPQHLNRGPRRSVRWFPNISAGLASFRYSFFPTVRQRAQKSIYQYLVTRSQRKQSRTSRLTAGPGKRSLASRPTQANDGVGSEEDPGSNSNNMAYTGPRSDQSFTQSLGLRSEGSKPGARRAKLAGYLKTANDLRQSYFTQDGARESHSVEDGPGAFPDAAVVRSGNEEMILFPSYARRHVKSKVRAGSERAS